MVQLRDQANVTGPTTSDGIVILTSQRASGPHPHPSQNGRIVPFSYVTHLLLADDTERFRCDYPTPNGPNPTCGKDTFTGVRSATAHMSSHVDRRGGYPDETLRTLVRAVRAYERAGYPDFNARVAAELTRTGVPTLDGEPWSADRVKKLFLRHRSEFRTHVRRSRVDRIHRESALDGQTCPLPTDTEDTVTAPEPTAGSATNDADRRSLAALDRRAAQLTRGTEDLLVAVQKHSEEVSDFISDIADSLRELAARPDVDPEVAEQAAKWREMRKLLDKD